MHEIGFEQMQLLGKALSHGARVRLLQLLAEQGDLSAGELAERLGLSGGAITGHIRALMAADLVRTHNVNGVHGVRKQVSLAHERLLLRLQSAPAVDDAYAVEIPVGSFVEHEIEPTCGLAAREGILGQLDDPRYFDDPAHFSADILWMMAGQVTYRIPNYVPKGRRICSIRITQEISSEAPGVCDDWPSRIRFALCGKDVGAWVSPGDYGDRRGMNNPAWWNDSLNQYGLRKTLTVNEQGSFMDGERIGDVTIDDLPVSDGQPLSYRLSVAREERGGGLTLFGKGFGNYGQSIAVQVAHAPR